MNRITELTPFMVMDVMKAASKKPDTIHFEVGQPDVSPPPSVIKAFKSAVDKKLFQYTDSTGIMPLKEKIAEFYKIKYNLNIATERIVLTAGTSAAFLAIYSLLLNSGDFIALMDPTYPCYKNFSRLLYIKPYIINVDKRTNYQITVDNLKKSKNIKALQISSPSNPTGSIYSRENLKELVEYCDENGIHFISDEIYHGLVYDNVKETTALEFSSKTFVINGFSKYFCMPGIRLGWLIAPEKYIRDIEKIVQNVYICPPTFSQYAAIEAFDYEYLEKTRKEYEGRRNFLYDELSHIFDIDAKPEGAFYLWANISKYCNDSYKFAFDLLEHAGVAVAPGIDFGENKTNSYIRFAYTRNIEHMQEGVSRIKKYLKIHN
jgi:aspartate/methionine/tyrosine aminotransferase